MAEIKVVSDIQAISAPIADVYAVLSDFNKIGQIVDMAKQAGAANNADINKATEQIEDVRFTTDACYIKLKNVGEIAIKHLELEEPKTIKLCGDGSVPMDFIIWIQLLDKGAYDTRLRLTIHAEMNMMLKMMLKGKLEKGINQFAEGLARIPYSMIR